MLSSSTYDKTADNTVKRKKDRASYDKATAHGIVREARICHVAFVDDEGLPQCMPMIGCVHEDERDGQVYMYFHGYISTRIVHSLSSPHTPMTATATLVDGLVLALNVSNHSVNYRSAVFHGVSAPFKPDDHEGKMEALRRVMSDAMPGRWEAVRELNDAEFREVGVVRMLVQSASAKIRKGRPGNDKEDLADEELKSKTWSGYIPLHTIAGAPMPEPYSEHLPVPEHVQALATPRQ